MVPRKLSRFDLHRKCPAACLHVVGIPGHLPSPPMALLSRLRRLTLLLTALQPASVQHIHRAAARPIELRGRPGSGGEASHHNRSIATRADGHGFHGEDVQAMVYGGKRNEVLAQ